MKLEGYRAPPTKVRLAVTALAISLSVPSCDVIAAVPTQLMLDGHFTAPAYVNGQGPFPFVLDTGADNSAIYSWFAEQLKLKSDGAQDLSGQTGSVKTPTYHLQSLTMDRRTIRHAFAYGLPNRHDQGRAAGIAGNDLMDGTVVAFDFPCSRIEIHPKPASVKSLAPRAQTIAAGSIADGTALTLPVEINGAEGVALLDTGSRDTRISFQFAKAAGIDSASPAFRDTEPIYGANSKAMGSRKGPIGTLRFGGLTLIHAEARVIDLPAFASAGVGPNVMILGADLMQGYRLIYDHQARQFSFSPSTCRR